MTKNEVRNSIAKLWGHFMRERKFSSAIIASTLMHSEGQSFASDQMIKESIQMVEATSNEFTSKQNSKSHESECSFCGQKPPAVKLAAGKNGFICNSCVTLLGEAFEK